MLHNNPVPPKFYKAALIVFATAAVQTLAQHLIGWGFEHVKKKVAKPEEKKEEKSEEKTP